MARSSFDGPIRIVRGSLVAQATDRTTAVTINAPAGQITTQATSLAAGAEVKFTVNNSFVTLTSVPVIACRSGQTADTSIAVVTAVAAGSFQITLTNLAAATADTGAMIINFIVFNGSNAEKG
jgi:fructoselysine-6-P-deglycase FrlB-like protein